MDVTVPRSQIDAYESKLQYLERENRRLRDSKLTLIMSTAKEMERLRQYIHSLTTSIGKLKGKNGDIEEKEETLIMTPTLCAHCGSATNVNNNYYISISNGPGNRSDDALNIEPKTEEKDNYFEEEDDAKQAFIESESMVSDDDGIIEKERDNFITPGRVSIVTLNTRGMSVQLTPNDLPSPAVTTGEHADIPLPDNFMDDSFVICDHCTSNLPLQFVRKYPDTMQCSKCHAFFEFIFLCNECGKCVCSECYEYEAKMQSIDRITSHFQSINDTFFDSQKLITFQQRISDESASTLNKIISINSSSLGINNQFSLKLCHLICYFMNDLDLCQMLNVSFAAQLFDIYWTLSPQKISVPKKFGFSDIHLSHSLKWAQSEKVWGIKQVIDDDIMIENYLSKNYKQITFDAFMTKLTKNMTETNTNYLKLLKMLKLIIDKDNIKSCECLDYKQFAWRELGGPPIICSKGMYFIWNIPTLQRSYCFNVDNRMLDQPFTK